MKPCSSPDALAKGRRKSNETFTAAGLQILLVQMSSEPDSDYSYNNKKMILLLKTATLKFAKPPTTTAHQNSCFLKSCFLCHKSLQLDKDVYMYRGDQGFCSIECRERQIFIDEMKETEISLNLTLQSIRHRRRCQTGTRVNDFRHDAAVKISTAKNMEALQSRKRILGHRSSSEEEESTTLPRPSVTQGYFV